MTEKRHPLANCEECPLREVGKYVPGQGPANARIAVIGEAPSKADTRSGKLFEGPAGKLLKTVLKHHGVDEQEVYFDNAVACRAPDYGPPAQSAIRACKPRLLAELDNRGVQKALALGNPANISLLGRDKVTTLRVGPPKSHPDRPNLKVIPSVNPAACLRQGDQFPHLVLDVGKVVYNAPNWVTPEYIVTDDVDSAIASLEDIDKRLTTGEGLVDNDDRVLVIDIEVDIEKDTAFDHPNHYGMLCVGIGYDRHRVLVLAEGVMGSESVRTKLGEVLRKHRIVAQNGKFDLAGLYPLLGPLEAFFDTMLASYVLDERPGIHGLKYMAVEYLGAPQYDDEIKKYIGSKEGYGAIPRPLLYRYNAFDVACTYELYLMFRDRLDQDDEGRSESGRGLRDVHDLLVAASNQLMYMELNGFTVDQEYLRTLDDQYIESLRKIEDELDGILGRNSTKNYDKRGGINPRSPLQVKAYLKDRGIRVDSTDKDTLELLLSRKTLPEHEEEVRAFIETLLRHRREAKMHGTYVKGIAKRLYRGRVYSTYMLHGTTTGRLASRNPNMQNIPRESSIRRIFIPSKPDHVLLQTDYSQAELRVLSHLSGDNYFRRIFNDGTIDVFDDLTPILYPDADKASLTKEEWKELRIRVKAYVYGVSYGRSEFSIAREFNISVNEARLGMERFFEVIPEIVEFRNKTRESVLAGNDLITPWGRHRRYALITKENVDDIMNEALAFIPQSTASDMCLQAMGWTRKETRGLAWVRNIIHDAILLECHRDDVEEVQAITERNMIKSAESIVGDYVKFAVETTTGNNWGEL